MLELTTEQEYLFLFSKQVSTFVDSLYRSYNSYMFSLHSKSRINLYQSEIQRASGMYLKVRKITLSYPEISHIQVSSVHIYA